MSSPKSKANSVAPILLQSRTLRIHDDVPSNRQHHVLPYSGFGEGTGKDVSNGYGSKHASHRESTYLSVPVRAWPTRVDQTPVHLEQGEGAVRARHPVSFPVR
jgi:hypothetical protein